MCFKNCLVFNFMFVL